MPNTVTDQFQLVLHSMLRRHEAVWLSVCRVCGWFEKHLSALQGTFSGLYQ